jgi:hypothetical protein
MDDVHGTSCAWFPFWPESYGRHAQVANAAYPSLVRSTSGLAFEFTLVAWDEVGSVTPVADTIAVLTLAAQVMFTG